MADLESVAFRTSMIVFKPESHDRVTKMARKAKMRKSDFMRLLMNAGMRSIANSPQKPDWFDA